MSEQSFGKGRNRVAGGCRTATDTRPGNRSLAVATVDPVKLNCRTQSVLDHSGSGKRLDCKDRMRQRYSWLLVEHIFVTSASKRRWRRLFSLKIRTKSVLEMRAVHSQHTFMPLKLAHGIWRGSQGGIVCQTLAVQRDRVQFSGRAPAPFYGLGQCESV